MILSEVDSDPEKEVWAQHDYRLILRKFIAWLRAEHGYPQGYPDREELIRILSLRSILPIAQSISQVVPGLQVTA